MLLTDVPGPIAVEGSGGRDRQLRDLARHTINGRTEEITLDLDLRIGNGVRTARDGLKLAAWLQAEAEEPFPLTGRSVRPEKLWRRDSLFNRIFSSDSPIQFADGLSGKPSGCGLVVSNAAWRRARIRAIDALIRELEPGFRHRFGNQVAAVRLLLGAVRCGFVDPEKGYSLLADLPAGGGQAGADGLLPDLVRRYIALVLKEPESQGQARERIRRSQMRLRALLIDDHAVMAGWSKVFTAVFGKGFISETEATSGVEHALGGEFDFVLVDMDLSEPGEGLRVIGEIRKKSFDLPIIAFSAHDRAEIAMQALRTGANYYFAKELDDARDRDSADYFRRFTRLVLSLPRYSSWQRRVWRQWLEVEARVDAWDAQPHSIHPSIRVADFVRSAYYFATARRVGANGEEVVDQRYRTCFGRPEFGAQGCLNLALTIFGDRLTGRDRAPCYDNTRELLEKMSLPASAWSVLLSGVAASKTRHRALTNASWNPELWFDQTIRFMEKVAGNELWRDQFEDEIRPSTTAAPAHLVVPFAGGSHHTRRAEGLAALSDGGATDSWSTNVPILVVDDEADDWNQLLGTRAKGGLHLLSAGESRIPVAPESLFSMNPTVILDLDWGAGPRPAIDFLRRLKDEWPWIPVIVVTAVDSSIALQQCLYEGATAYWLLGKPADGSSAYWGQFRKLLEKATGLSKLPMPRVWEILRSGTGSWKKFPSATGMQDLAKLSAFCAYPDRNPAERWRQNRLLDAGREGDGFLKNMAVFLACRAAESTKEIGSAPDPADLARLKGLRNAAVKGDKVPMVAAFIRSDPVKYLFDALIYINQLASPRKS